MSDPVENYMKARALSFSPFHHSHNESFLLCQLREWRDYWPCQSFRPSPISFSVTCPQRSAWQEVLPSLLMVLHVRK